jgi:hypothetical protein
MSRQACTVDLFLKNYQSNGGSPKNIDTHVMPLKAVSAGGGAKSILSFQFLVITNDPLEMVK